MDCTVTGLSFRDTAAFSKLAVDYVEQAPALAPFYEHAPTLEGVKKSIAARKKFNTNRAALVDILRRQYADLELNEAVQQNIERLLSPDTFTITTAHQNNIFTGPLYFIYKILHTIRLADDLKKSIEGAHFVPVYYIGSEDADLQELNHIYINGDKLEWNTAQSGAVGRMKIDAKLVKLIDRLEGELSVEPHGKEIIELLRRYYKVGVDVQTATFHFVNHLFAEYGLIVLLPDQPDLKRQMIPLFEDELLNQKASAIVANTAIAVTEAGYKTQAHPREINLFYLRDDKRERIVEHNGRYEVLQTDWNFSKEEMLAELQSNPERFSPNVILRGLYQETILPNIIFTGGGGEIAYWLELKDLFKHYQTPYPVLMIRNSFMVIEKKWKEKIDKLGFGIEGIFEPALTLINKLVARETENQLKLNGTLSDTKKLYESIKEQAGSIDKTLEKHVEALKTKTVYRLKELEKKMLRAEKRKFADQQRHIEAMKAHLFPGNGLQERRENMAYYYAKWGKDFIHQLYRHSPAIERKFVVLCEA